MGLIQWIQMFFLKHFGISRIEKLNRLEQSLADEPDAIRSVNSSPKRFNIPLETMRLVEEERLKMNQTMRMSTMRSIISNIEESIESVEKNPDTQSTKQEIDEHDFTNLEAYAQELGVGPIGYAMLSPDLIFEDFGVLFDKTIILAMEMESEEIQKAPSQDTFDMIHETYDDLGIAANRITDFLRRRGFAAHAGHPLGGLTLYPPHAQMAGIGWIGRHGLLITPEFGPRVRLAAVYTSIENLPFSENNPHEWIEDFCQQCGLCISQCPANAIYEEPIVDEAGHETHIERESCFRYFAQNYGCSICIKVCPFSKASYDRLRANTKKRFF